MCTDVYGWDQEHNEKIFVRPLNDTTTKEKTAQSILFIFCQHWGCSYVESQFFWKLLIHQKISKSSDFFFPTKSKGFTFGRIQILRSINVICEYGFAQIPGLMNGTSIDLYGKCLCDT